MFRFEKLYDFPHSDKIFSIKVVFELWFFGLRSAKLTHNVPSLQVVCELDSRVVLDVQKTLLNNGNSTKPAYHL